MKRGCIGVEEGEGGDGLKEATRSGHREEKGTLYVGEGGRRGVGHSGLAGTVRRLKNWVRAGWPTVRGEGERGTRTRQLGWARGVLPLLQVRRHVRALQWVRRSPSAKVGSGYPMPFNARRSRSSYVKTLTHPG